MQDQSEEDGRSECEQASEHPAEPVEGEEEENGNDNGEDEMLSDLPAEALKAASYSQFVNHMRPYAWVKFPSATAAEVNALIKVRWNLLKKMPKSGEEGNLTICVVL